MPSVSNIEDTVKGARPGRSRPVRRRRFCKVLCLDVVQCDNTRYASVNPAPAYGYQNMLLTKTFGVIPDGTVLHNPDFRRSRLIQSLPRY
jgi:hypothetical protein